MGIELVKLLAARHAAGLSHRALVVLLYMALHALDTPNAKGQPPRLYFAGWEPLADALGYDSLTRAAEEKVRRAIKELRNKGLIEPTAGHAQTGTRQSYRLHLTLKVATESPTDSEGYSPTDSEGQEPHRIGVDSPTDSEGPRTHTGQIEDSFQDSTRIPPSASTDRAGGPTADEMHVDWSRVHEFTPEDDSDRYCRCGRHEDHGRHYPRSA